MPGFVLDDGASAVRHEASLSIMSVVTRFAPSPTGFLHIGGARTALFNWLFARHHGGRYLLRIEDTDRARSTEAAIQAILDGLGWLGLTGDEPPVFQSERQGRHAEVARALLERGAAYACYCTPEELQEMRAKARAEGRSTTYDGRWRDRDSAEAPAGVRPAIRLKAPRTGETIVADRVQGEVRFDNAQLDDMVLLRSDGTSTYMLSVVVDDHDMGVSHIIRGDDHLVNAARQTQLYRAQAWPVPEFAHIPLIHGPDGAKLSKRHGALGIDAYREMGFLPEALRNYLLRLGWSHGDDEIISIEQAIAWFDLDAVGKGAARFDMARLTSLNAHYLRATDDRTLARLIAPRLEAQGYRVRRHGARPARGGHGRPQTACDHPGRSRRERHILCCSAAGGAERGGGAVARSNRTRTARGPDSGAERRQGMAALSSRGGDPRLRRGREPQARSGCAAVARGAHRLDRFARDLRGDGGPGPRGDARAA